MVSYDFLYLLEKNKSLQFAHSFAYSSYLARRQQIDRFGVELATICYFCVLLYIHSKVEASH